MHKESVRKFYKRLWNPHDKDAMPSVLHQDFTFRGSLGLEKRGLSGFAEYIDMVHEALGQYRWIIVELVSEGDKIFAKLTFTGIHQGEFMGTSPTQQRVSWNGCALFTFKDERIADVWVLGDLRNVEEQLNRNEIEKAAPADHRTAGRFGGA